MVDLQLAHTSALSPAQLGAVRGLLEDVFPGELTDDDYEHALGGMHALVWDGDELVGHGSVVLRRLLHGDRALRTGYVEGVAVRAQRRREGHGARLMAALEDVVRGGYELGALASSDEALRFYASRGWQPWTGTASVLAPTGVERTADDEDCLFILPVSVELDPDGDLACDWRDGDVW